MAALESRRSPADPGAHYLVLACQPVGKVRRFTSSEPYVTARIVAALRSHGWVVVVLKSLPGAV